MFSQLITIKIYYFPYYHQHYQFQLKLLNYISRKVLMLIIPIRMVIHHYLLHPKKMMIHFYPILFPKELMLMQSISNLKLHYTLHHVIPFEMFNYFSKKDVIQMLKMLMMILLLMKQLSIIILIYVNIYYHMELNQN